jgi:hypothetical protein
MAFTLSQARRDQSEARHELVKLLIYGSAAI